MFTLEQIESAHRKVKSGADFPSYISEIKNLGVTSYETFVSDGRTDFFGLNNFKTSLPSKYIVLKIAEVCNALQFKSDLLAHQQGKTDYLSFCNDIAKSGIEKWMVRIEKRCGR